MYDIGATKFTTINEIVLDTLKGLPQLIDLHKIHLSSISKLFILLSKLLASILPSLENNIDCPKRF
ncbi:MAG: hypothetical protein ACI86M_001502 [Saprospiraceae bacterium]|jgi:hypothetical protein